MSTITTLSNTIGAGARATKYRVAFAFPGGVSGKTSLEDVDVLAKAAMAPAKEIGTIELFNQGRKILIPGDTQFDGAWNLSFYLTEDHALRLEQLDSAGNVTAQYTMHHCFPSSIGEVSYDDASQDTIAEFDVTFAYSDWVIGTGEFSDYTIPNATENDTAL